MQTDKGADNDQAIKKFTRALMERLADDWKNEAMQAEIREAEAAAAMADTKILEELEARLPSGAQYSRCN